jgi:16S rRNA (cytosine1402-N4)-methyltransferase
MHQPVLLREVVDYLNIKPNGFYIDGTFGQGGHTKAILEKLGKEGKLLAIDKDPIAITAANAEAFKNDARFTIQQGSFTEIEAWAKKLNWVEKVDGILLDLGISSPQVDTAERGFSFQKEGPLDMRMNPNIGMDAATWVNKATAYDIAQVLKEYGEERFAKRISSAIVQARKKQRIITTTQLAEIITKACPSRERKKHPATRSFQAIRIFINSELEELHTCLSQSVKILAAGGRLLVITFHSLEDRIVKQFMRSQEKEFENFKRVSKKAIRPEWPEIKENRRARSAILRVIEKVN